MKKRECGGSFASRTLALALAAVLLFGLCACGESGTGGSDRKESTPSGQISLGGENGTGNAADGTENGAQNPGGSGGAGQSGQNTPGNSGSGAGGEQGSGAQTPGGAGNNEGTQNPGGNGGSTVETTADLRVIQYCRSNARFIVNGIPDDLGANDSCQIRFDADGGTYCIRLEKNSEEVCRICFQPAGAGDDAETELDYGRCAMTLLSAEGNERVIDMNFWENDLCLDDVESFILRYLKNNGSGGQAEKVFAAADVVEYPVMVCDEYEDDGNGGIIIKHIARPEEYHQEMIYGAIPERIDGKPVTVIGRAGGLVGCELLVLPDSVVEISKAAFQTAYIANIRLPESLKRIGRNAFDGAQLESITIPAGVTEIESYAFANCDKLQSITILGGNAVIEELAFLPGADTDCMPNLTSLSVDAKSIGNGAFTHIAGPFTATIKAETIGEGAFRDCKMMSATISADIVGNNAFAWCEQLTDVNFEKVRVICDEAFTECHSLAHINFPEGLEIIESRLPVSTFMWCTSLTNVTLPESLQEVGEFLFLACPNLTDVTFLGNTKIGEHAFAECFDVCVTYNGSTYDYSTVESIYTK